MYFVVFSNKYEYAKLTDIITIIANKNALFYVIAATIDTKFISVSNIINVK